LLENTSKIRGFQPKICELKANIILNNMYSEAVEKYLKLFFAR